MNVLTIRDLDKEASIRAIRLERQRMGFGCSYSDAEALWKVVGGRLSHISHCVRHPEMVEEAERLLSREKEWLLGRTGLIQVGLVLINQNTANGSASCRTVTTVSPSAHHGVLGLKRRRRRHGRASSHICKATVTVLY